MAIISNQKRPANFHHEPTAEDAEFLARRKFRAPRHPFVVFRGKRIEHCGEEKQAKLKTAGLTVAKLLHVEENEVELIDGTSDCFVYQDLLILNVAGVQKQPHKVDDLIRKGGWRVIAWGNFPKPDSYQAKQLSDGPGKPGPWEILDAHLRVAVGEVVAREGREREMAKEIEEQRKVNERLNAEIEAMKRKGKA